MYKFNLFQFKEVCRTDQRQRDLFFCQVGPIEGPSPKPRSGHRIVYHKGKIYSFGGFNPAVDGADPDLEGDEYWQDSKPLFKVRSIMEVKGFQFNLKELWELNLTTRRWTKSQMKGEIPEQLVGVVKYYKILRSLILNWQLPGITHSSRPPLPPWSDVGLRWNRGPLRTHHLQHSRGLSAGDPAVLQARRCRRSRAANAPLRAGRDHRPGAGLVLHGGRDQRVQLLHGRQRPRPSEFPSSLAVPLSVVRA